MLDLLLAVAAAALLAAAALAALSAVTLAPFVVALGLAEARHASPARWGALALAGSLLGLALVALLLRADGVPTAPALLPLLLTWGAPAALRLLGDDAVVVGRAGRHE